MAARCTICENETRVIDTTKRDRGYILTLRRRECGTCGARFTTYEIEREKFREIFAELEEMAATLSIEFVERRESVLNIYGELAKLLARTKTDGDRITEIREVTHKTTHPRARAARDKRRAQKKKMIRERNVGILNLRDEEPGLTLRQIADRHGLTGERIRQIIEEQREIEQETSSA